MDDHQDDIIYGLRSDLLVTTFCCFLNKGIYVCVCKNWCLTASQQLKPYHSKAVSTVNKCHIQKKNSVLETRVELWTAILAVLVTGANYSTKGVTTDIYY